MVWRVLIVEDDSRMREYLADSIHAHRQLALAGTAGTVADAWLWLKTSASPIDVMLVDIGLPDGSGIDLIRMAKEAQPECEAMVISVFGDDQNVTDSIEAGALGYIHKDAAPEDIASEIIAMKNGASPISPMIARRLLERFEAINKTTAKIQTVNSVIDDCNVALTPKETEVLHLIARGYSYEEIGNLQEVSVHTVRTHIKSLYGKLAVHSRSEAVFEATKLGLLAGVF